MIIRYSFPSAKDRYQQPSHLERTTGPQNDSSSTTPVLYPVTPDQHSQDGNPSYPISCCVLISLTGQHTSRSNDTLRKKYSGGGDPDRICYGMCSHAFLRAVLGPESYLVHYSTKMC
eukprot:766806-Hanusia_phi.AAC.3